MLAIALTILALALALAGQVVNIGRQTVAQETATRNHLGRAMAASGITAQPRADNAALATWLNTRD